MLFEDDGQPPGIIDLTFFWRPAKTGEAIAVADGLMWHGEGDDLVVVHVGHVQHAVAVEGHEPRPVDAVKGLN